MSNYLVFFQSLKGGPGSGHHGHEGIPGHRGGSAASSTPVNEVTKAKAIEKALKYWGEKEAARQVRELEKLVKDVPVSVRVPLSAFEKILNEGEFKTQHETGTSQGTLDTDFRKAAEKHMFGENELPIYGYVSTGKNYLNPSVIHYGDVKIDFKESIKDRTTVTYGDSLQAFDEKKIQVGTPIRKPGLEGIGNMDYGDGPPDYVEAQIHRGAKVSDIAKVYLDKGKKAKLKNVTKKLDELQIPYTWVNKRADYND